MTVTVTFEPVNEILWCDYQSESYVSYVPKSLHNYSHNYHNYNVH